MTDDVERFIDRMDDVRTRFLIATMDALGTALPHPQPSPNVLSRVAHAVLRQVQRDIILIPRSSEPVHVYRNRADDTRGPDDLVYCPACRGWYGVPHTGSHCQTRDGRSRPDNCACRPCREARSAPVEGTYGFFTTAKEWQPPGHERNDL